ncbi:MAG: hypothetical protein UR39_C0002G0001 [Candidatus Woesebacteria bacterium GW2011_GWA1_33_30]|uniref:AAA domain-containing protein n=1 Tax=Candidatus Woesebacteria bacterium GW2011_GWA2_33_28 TaxID=1618561 RepID=A0A0F9ZU80_9BACT|nr:MAG: hypothetical protein UR38_C0002G0001 [Candidatus Woesebacteria bacterium GW2011_GWA2_33_28]KKP48711.1 MAG: hypothetical protein UR39_C0002G0001 [Candidatus Woesebacteria bacterium GW2011_GWA1_33_30]KKP49984.1 MAG: hypothetical protein UR40_C0002G0001 [Microgenomates group bacterium GW2011_GWC1_33_32]KKP51755.1 MAG: hypothetical protein UR44_C0006G0001 [Candidatus Woesebacteria bacterium GW2011_GWB1_33_38]
MNLYNLEELLVSQNPQFISGKIDEVGYKRDIFPQFCHELKNKKLIITLNGPRRSGKTFIIKQGMRYLIENGVSPKNVSYFQFSSILNDKEIIIKLADIFLKKYSIDGQKYLFLDEVQLVDFWQDQVKFLYDTFKDIKIIVSGSTSLFYKQRSVESLAGRIYKIKLGALNFHEYLRFKKIDEPSNNRAEFITNLNIYRSEFRKYLSFGQYPEVVANSELDYKKYIHDLADQIINFDALYFLSKINRQLFLDTIKTLSFDLAEEFSVNNVAKILNSDRREIGEYVKILSELNLFNTCFNFGLKSMRKKLSGSKKIYALNSNLTLNVNGFDISYLNDSRVYGKYLENYVYTRLIDKYEKVEYFRVDGKEIDFVTEKDCFEVKLRETHDLTNCEKISVKLNKKFNLLTEEEVFLL